MNARHASEKPRSPRRGRLSWALALAAATALMGLTACREKPARPLVPPAGPNAAAVSGASLPALDASALLDWAASEKTPVLISLWAEWCGPCLAEMPFLAEAAKTHAARLRVVAVNVDPRDADAMKAVDAVLAKLRPQLPLAWARDGASVFAKGLGVTWPGVLPFQILIAPDGRVLNTYAGPLDGHDEAGRAVFAIEVLGQPATGEAPL